MWIPAKALLLLLLFVGGLDGDGATGNETTATHSQTSEPPASLSTEAASTTSDAGTTKETTPAPGPGQPKPPPPGPSVQPTSMTTKIDTTRETPATTSSAAGSNAVGNNHTSPNAAKSLRHKNPVKYWGVVGGCIAMAILGAILTLVGGIKGFKKDPVPKKRKTKRTKSEETTTKEKQTKRRK